MLSKEQEKLALKKIEFAKTKDALRDFQEKRFAVQRKIREERELFEFDQRTPVKDFFKVVRDVSSHVFTEDIAEVLRSKLASKEALLQSIEPIVKHMKGRIYFSLTKRKQRKQLNALSKQLTRDVYLLKKSLQLFC